MNQVRKFRKNKDATKKKIKKLKSTTLKLSLIMLNFIFATFAWFTYTIILDNKVDVNVSAWQVDFKENTTVLGNNMVFQVEKFYPGMTDIKKSIGIENLGDRAASIDYEISELKILGQSYQIKEVAQEGDSVYTLYKGEITNTTTGMKTIKLLNDSTKFPFEITIQHSIQIDIANPSNANQNKGVFEICFTWPYEITGTEAEITAKNSLDTTWGHNIATFYNSQVAGDTTQGIEMTLKAIAKQII